MLIRSTCIHAQAKEEISSHFTASTLPARTGDPSRRPKLRVSLQSLKAFRIGSLSQHLIDRGWKHLKPMRGVACPGQSPHLVNCFQQTHQPTTSMSMRLCQDRGKCNGNLPCVRMSQKNSCPYLTVFANLWSQPRN